MPNYNIIVIISLCLMVMLAVIILIKIQGLRNPNDDEENDKKIKGYFAHLQKRIIENSAQNTTQIQQLQNSSLLNMQKSVIDRVEKMSSEQISVLNDITRTQNSQLNTITQQQLEQLAKNSKVQTESLKAMETSILSDLSQYLYKMQQTTDKRLSDIQESVNSKLDTALNERLDSNFEKVANQLSELYKSLGELDKMSSGISDLNHALSNVKTRGTWGEAQLRDIIQETMVPSQYEENVITKKSSNDPVEFAIKIPSKEDSGEYILLPIDSKFPMDIYNSVVDASESNDVSALSKASKALEMRIKEEARKIRDKYISVPDTTNFAIMFLPTESLYAEVLRMNGVAEYCQNNYGIIISGPTTITALLNSLRVGFQNLTLSKKAEDVKKLLIAIKQNFDKLDELIDTTQKKLEAASVSNEKLKKRSGIIIKRLGKVSGEISPAEGDSILGIETTDNDLDNESDL